MPHSKSLAPDMISIRLNIEYTPEQWEHLKEIMDIKHISIQSAAKRALILWELLAAESQSEITLLTNTNKKIKITGI